MGKPSGAQKTGYICLFPVTGAATACPSNDINNLVDQQFIVKRAIWSTVWSTLHWTADDGPQHGLTSVQQDTNPVP